MPNTIQLRRSATANAVPTTTQLALGELAINTYDGRLYLKKNVSGTESIVEVGTVSSGDQVAAGDLVSNFSSGDEGGQIRLSKSVTNTVLNTGITIDVYQNRLRIFETGGTNRGVYIDLSSATAGVGTNLLAGGGGGASISIGDTPPGSPTSGSLWWDSTSGNLKIYYNDGTSSQWVAASSNTYGSGGSSITSSDVTTALGYTPASLTGSNTLSGTNTFSSVVDITGSVRQGIVAVAASAIDCSLGNYFTKTATGALTWTFTNVPATRAVSVLLELTNGGTGTQTWPAAVKWPGGTAPTLTTAGVDLMGFITDDGGTTWRGVQLMKDSK